MMKFKDCLFVLCYKEKLEHFVSLSVNQPLRIVENQSNAGESDKSRHPNMHAIMYHSDNLG
jgi:hypothetical protein